VTDEREGDKIHPFLEPDLEVGAVFFRKGCDPEVGLREIDAFAGGDRSAYDYATEKTVLFDLAHLELRETVSEEDALTGADVLEEVRVADGEDAVFDLSVNPQRYGRTCFEMDSLFGEFSETDLGAPEILEDADLAIE
jgi:hypothetical protein